MENERLWPLQDAKAKFSEVVRLSQEEPQAISVRGEPKSVIVSMDYFQKLLNSKPTLQEVLATMPCRVDLTK
jgi:prevent-host-death family protein